MLTQVEQWQAATPDLVGVLDCDAEALARYGAAADGLLAALPPKPERDEGQQSLVDQVFAARRKICDRFMHLHAEQVYSELTNNRTEYHRLSELVHAAAQQFPGLVPTRAQLDAERAHIQAEKDGREIDQGVFFRGLLRSPVAGAHLTDAMLLPTVRARELLAAFRADGSTDLGSVLVERRGSAAHLTIRNEACLNAEDDRLIADMETAVDLALLDDDVRVGVLRGGIMRHPRYLGKRVFSAGINLRELHEGRISFVDFLLARELGYISKIARGLLVDPSPDAHSFPDRTVHKPWVAAVDSFAIGGGMQLLMVFDWVIAAEDAYFSLPAAQEGIVPGAANLRLGGLTGGRLSRRVILGGHRIRATDPEASLVCDEVVPSAEVTAAVEAAVQFMDNPAVVANRRMINLAEEPADRFRVYMGEFALLQAFRLFSRDVTDKVGRAWSRAGGQA